MAKVLPTEYFYSIAECIQWVKHHSQYKGHDAITRKIEHELSTDGISNVILNEEVITLVLY